MVTTAPALMSPAAFPAPTGPAPTTSTRRPASLRKSGNRGSVIRSLHQCGRRHVQPALRLLATAPTARADVFPFADGRRAGLTADTGIAPIVQRVVGNIVLP